MFIDTDGVMSESVMYVYTAMVHTDCISICQAKRVKTEEGGAGKMSSKEVEAVVLGECKKHQQWLAPPVLPFSVPLPFSFPVPPCSLQPLPPRVSIRLSQGQAVKSESQLLACLYVCACVPSAATHACRPHHMLWMHRRHQICPHRRTTRSTIFIRMLHSGVSVCVFPCAQVCIRACMHACVRVCVHVCAWCV